MKASAWMAAFLLAAMAATLAAAELPDGKWWKRPRLAQEIGLTPDQQLQIEKIFVRSRTKLIDLRGDLEKKQLGLQESMEDRNADRRDVEKRIESVENARAELQKARALMILDMKQVLKPEQWDRLLRRREEMIERRQEMRERMRDEGAAPPDQRPQARPQPESRPAPERKSN
ncbi:MAG TPA: periplasmic heavy metal sensor [Thermoanaerobaculia bacterium]|nr:periplasmic heavy metal sensor [Thermoanaerobaculia bacterium]